MLKNTLPWLKLESTNKPRISYVGIRVLAVGGNSFFIFRIYLLIFGFVVERGWCATVMPFGKSKGLVIASLLSENSIVTLKFCMQAALYHTDFRPVPLEEYIKVGNTIYDKKLDIVRTISRTANLGGKDPDHIVELCNEVWFLLIC